MASKNFVKEAETEPVDDTAGEDLQTQIAALQATVSALLQAQTPAGMSEDRLEMILARVAQMSADAQERAANPSNKTHPAISVFSNPLGDREHPRPDLKCPMFWIGYPIEKDTTTAEEIQLLNLAEPGLFAFKRIDGRTTETLTITGERDPAGHVSRLLFTFPIAENRDTLPPTMAAMLRQAFKVKTAEEQELDALRAEVTKLRAEPVGAR